MTITSATSTSDGVTATFSIPFPFFSRTHVSVLVDDVAYTGVVTWVSDSLVSLNPIPANGVKVTRKRITPDTPAKASFTNTNINATGLNNNQTQDLYLAQEAATEAARALRVVAGEAGVLIGGAAERGGFIQEYNSDGTSRTNRGFATLLAELGVLLGLDDLLAPLSPTADKVPYFISPTAMALATLTSYARTLLDDATASAARITLELVPGTDVQAFDADLLALGAAGSAADTVPYYTGAGSAARTALPALARQFLEAPDSESFNYTNPGSGGVIRTGESKLADWTAVADNGAKAGATAAQNVAAFNTLFGSPTRGKVTLDPITYDVGATQVSISGSNLWIKGVPGLTVITSALIDQLVAIGSISNVVIEDILFKTTLVGAPEGDGLIKTYYGNITNLTFIRCGFDASTANTNAINLIFGNPSGGAGTGENIHFYDCYIVGAGRMGIEVQNQYDTGASSRYEGVVWEGGSIKNTGLLNAYGMGVSLTGYGGGCRIGRGTLFENNLYANIENVGASRSVFSGRIKSNAARGTCDILSFTNTRRMYDNTIEDLVTMETCAGGYIVRNQERLSERGVRLDMAGIANYHDCDNLRSYGSIFKTTGVVALLAQSGCTNNVWDRPILDNSANAGAYSIVRFVDATTTNNHVARPTLVYGSSGSFADQITGAAGNFITDPVGATGAPIGGFAAKTSTFVAADIDLSADPVVSPFITLAGTPAGPFSLILPPYYPFRPNIKNNTGQTITVKAPAQAGQALATGSSAAANFDGTDFKLT